MRCQRSEAEQMSKVSVVWEGVTTGDGNQVQPG